MAAAKPNGCFGSHGLVRLRGRVTAGYHRSISPAQRVRHAASRNDTVGHDLRERHQHEGAFEQPGMRQRQFRLVDLDVVIGDQIEVEGARTPALLAGAVAAELLFDLVQREQQRMGIEAGFDFDAGIDEAAPALRRPRAAWRSPTTAPASAACVMPQILEIAFWNVARTSPTLPPSAISTSAMSRAIAGCVSAPRRRPRKSRRSARAACAR